jgi:hypothetical protein
VTSAYGLQASLGCSLPLSSDGGVGIPQCVESGAPAASDSLGYLSNRGAHT